MGEVEELIGFRKFTRSYLESLSNGNTQSEPAESNGMPPHFLGDEQAWNEGKALGSQILADLKTYPGLPKEAPLLSDVEQLDKLHGFLDEFGVSRLCDLLASKAVKRAGFIVEIIEVMHEEELRDLEKINPVGLPAVRIEFIPRA